jgi:transposase
MADMDTRGAKRRRWPEALKREIVAAASRPGASVSEVARQYDVNANQVSGWRRRFSQAGGSQAGGSQAGGSQAGEPLPTSSAMPSSRCGLVPVTITPTPGDEGAAPLACTLSDAIEIEVSGDVRIRVGSNFDGRALRRVLDVLRQR